VLVCGEAGARSFSNICSGDGIEGPWAGPSCLAWERSASDTVGSVEVGSGRAVSAYDCQQRSYVRCDTAIPLAVTSFAFSSRFCGFVCMLVD